jgi:hypothetical protein
MHRFAMATPEGKIPQIYAKMKACQRHMDPPPALLPARE